MMTQSVESGPSQDEARPRDASPRPTGFRADIQGLRAVAVSLVLLYHLWPNRLTGGFVGVDVFFVISGFLITSHLVKRMPRTGRDLAEFWARRIRRLLPAALLVLVATLLASRLFGPDTQWENTALDAMAAALYGENWRLATSAVDYLASENAASPVQHFWSLSVEEQFYIFWPVVILLLGLLAFKLRLSRLRTVLVGLTVIVALSLTYSIVATHQEPASAYFVTPTRVWELGVGALLAVAVATLGDRPLLGPPTSKVRSILALLGFALVAVAAFSYTAKTPFPGWQALLPIIGAAMVIGANSDGTGFSPTRILALRPVQWLGDISYSVYLWHWPMIVLLPYVSGGHLGLLDKVAVLAASLVLGTLSKKYVEDIVRFGARTPGLKQTYLIGAGVMAFVLVLGGLQLGEVRYNQAKSQKQLEQALSGDNPCFGASALAKGDECQPVRYDELVPSAAEAPDDKSDAYSDSCWVYPPFPTTKSCTFGDPKGEVSIALLGNSHAGHWLPALQEIAEKRHWKITTYLASECTTSRAPVEWDTDAKQKGCLEWSEKVQKQIIDGDFDVVVASNRNVHPAVGKSLEESQPVWQQGYRDYLAEFDRRGQQVVVIRDNPFPGKSVPDCLSANSDNMDKCNGSREDWLPRDPMFEAAKELGSPRVKTVELTDYLCREDKCPAVIGGVVVYFDGSHMTATYARTLAPYLLRPLDLAITRSR